MNTRLLLCTMLTLLTIREGVAEMENTDGALPQAWWGSVGPVQESTYQRPELPGYEGRYNPWYGVPRPSEEEYLSTFGVEPWRSPGKPQEVSPAYPNDDGRTYEGYYDPYRFGYYAPRPQTGVIPYGPGIGATYPYRQDGAPDSRYMPRPWSW